MPSDIPVIRSPVLLVTDGCFYGNGMFRVAPPLELKKLEAIVQHKSIKMLPAKGKADL
ncbi:MAG: hypothetical protein AAB299_06315 [Thermodesulfobacteriota bacterium]